MTILIVDDAPILRAIFARIATSLGYVLIGEASRAEEAIDLARSLAPHAVVIDGRFPGAGIEELVSGVRRAAPEAGVFVVASIDETALARTAVEYGAAGVLLRPFSRLQIASRLGAWAASAARDRA